VPSPEVVATLDTLSVWRMPVAEVRAVTEAVDGARGEAARTALSLVEQASSGLRILSVTAEGEESKKEVRGGWHSETSSVGLAT
jgi:hypothetical protein